MNLLLRKTTAFAYVVLILTTYDADAQTTMYGALLQKPDMNTKLISANNLGIKYVRDAQLLSKWTGTKSYNIDFWKTHKKKMLLNINNDSTPSAFPTDLVAYESKLRSFLNVYASSIQLAVIENEELNSSSLQGNAYHLGSIQDYINELAVAVNVCQQIGVPVTNGGLTSPIVASLRHYYIVNGKQDSLVWLVQNMNGVSTDSTLWLRTDSLLSAYKVLPLSFVNLHWYEPAKDSTTTHGVLQVVCNYITQQTGKKVITNETGVRTTDSSFVTMLLQQWHTIGVAYCMFYDGTGSFGAQALTSPTADLLPTGVAFRNFVAGKNSCEQSITVTPSGSIETCAGSNFTLSASDGFSNYLWSTGDTSRVITIKTTDNYSVTSTTSNCTAFSNGVAVLVNKLPAKPVITSSPSPATNLCPNKTAKLTSSSAAYYLWNTGGTTKTITVNKPGNYLVTVTDVNGCKNTSDPAVVTYQSCSPPINLRVADLTQFRAMLNWDTVQCSVGYQYQYRVKGSLMWTTGQVVNGATSSRYIYNLKPSTTYEWRIQTRCRITPDTLLSDYANGPDFSTLAPAIAQSSNNESQSNFEERIFPIPAKDFATLELSSIMTDLKIELRDLNGKLLWENDRVTETKITIPLSAFASGIYVVILRNKEYNKVIKLVKE
ncbi:MAG TPA: T9SS type A sorting domain-containing protein [Parafilimonas sp.]|nr:T9SS type A sorting domain-containing protein [Parafilimonas sp.]